MSLHSNKKDFSCPNCSTTYIPYKFNLQCPKCGLMVEAPEYFDFIDISVRSLRNNKIKFGSFTPPAWATYSFQDQIQSIIFKLFTAVEAQKPDDLSKFIDNALSSSDTEAYLQKHIKDIFFEVNSVYDKLPKIKITPLSKLREGVIQKLKLLLP